MFTETPIERSLKNSEALHIVSPSSHDGLMNIVVVKGTVVTMTRRSAMANDNMYLMEIFKINSNSN